MVRLVKRELRGFLLASVLVAWPSAATAQADDPTAGSAGPEAPAPDADEAEAEDANEDETPNDGFFFGSYGRVVAAGDLDGSLGSDADIVRHDPRIDEGTYVELELRREDALPNGMRSIIVANLAIAGDLFHLDGEFSEALAIRNLFAEVRNAGVEGLSLWAGSRMVRGDDIYLLDVWPMDNLNALGGGLRFDHEDVLSLALTFGMARPNDPFQHQVVETVADSGFDAASLVVLDRPRVIVAAKGTYFPLGWDDDFALKVSAYGEFHYLPSGSRRIEGMGIEDLPRDDGQVFGLQVGAWFPGTRNFINVFLRYAKGLAVYDPLGVPFTVGTVQSTDRAQEVQLGLSANFESGMFGLQVGAYYRNFRDADPGVFDRNRLAEGAIALRPQVWFGDHVGLALDTSYQAMETTAFDEVTGRPERGGVFKFGFIPFFSPFGRGTYTRPHLRIIYTLTHRDADAMRLYPVADPRSQNANEHFLGIGAEWWFDSTSYR